MEIKGEVKDVPTKNNTNPVVAHEKSALNFYGIAGIIIVIIGVLVALFTNLVGGITTAALGVIVLGIGEILRYIIRIANR